MTSTIPGWSYSSKVPTGRALALMAWGDFNEIVAAVTAADLMSAEWELFRTAVLAGCHRLSVVLRVPPNVYDAYYNAPIGVRAQYARSEHAGEAADRLAIASLEARLLKFAHIQTQIAPELLRGSLRGAHAKTWIVESEVQDQESDNCICFEPWARASLAGEGLHAPVGTLLEVKGGWLDLGGTELLNPAKIHRSYTISKTGFI